MPDIDIEYFPDKYGENYLYLLEVDPTHVHALWEVIPDSIPAQIREKSTDNPELCLKIYCDPKDSRLCEEHGVCLDLNVQGFINDWFVELEEPPVRCHAELGYYDPGEGVYIALCRSNDLNIFLGPEAKFGLNEPENQEIDEEKIEASETDPAAQQGGHDETNQSFENQQREERSHLMERITEKDIKDCYQFLPEKLLSDPDFSPWRSIIEKMSSEEAMRVLRLSELMNLYIKGLSPSEIHSSYQSAITDPSAFLKTILDR